MEIKKNHPKTDKFNASKEHYAFTKNNYIFLYIENV